MTDAFDPDWSDIPTGVHENTQIVIKNTNLQHKIHQTMYKTIKLQRDIDFQMKFTVCSLIITIFPRFQIL